MKDEGPDHAHSTPIRTPGQLMTVIALAFVVPIIGIVMLTQYITSTQKPDPGALAPEAVARRIKPVADVALADATPSGPKVAKSGEDVYKTVCSTCHATGLAGAFKFGDKAVWAPHIAQGLDALAKNAMNGIRGMPARGGNASLSDLEVTRAVVYMTNAAGANFKEPAAPKDEAKPATTAAGAPAARSGEQIVQAACGNCHLTGEGGAPKVGDKAAWAKRISRGVNSVTASAIKGHGGMPARGGQADLTDAELKSAILYMFGAAGAKIVPDAAPAAAAAPAQVAAAPAADGKAVYDKVCMVCHAAGVAGAPKLGDKALWAPRINTGMEALYASSIKGKGAMPAKGGNVALPDADVKAAVDYMVNAAK